MKKVTSLLLALVLCMALCIPAFAEEQQTICEADLGAPIKVIHTVDENGNPITERIYFVPNPGTVSLRSTEGSGTLYKYKDAYFSQAENEHITFYVAGYFTWSPDEVTVYLPFGDWNRSTVPSGCEVSGSMGDQGNSTWYRGYAFATYELTYTTLIGVQSSSVVINVDKNGNVS